MSGICGNYDRAYALSECSYFAKGKSERSEKIILDDSSLKINGISIYVNSKDKNANGILVDNSDLKITLGYNYGLVGKNGAGKSCLFDRLLSDEIPLKSKMSIGYLNQNIGLLRKI